MFEEAAPVLAGEHVHHFKSHFYCNECDNHPFKTRVMNVCQLAGKKLDKFTAVIQFFVHYLQINMIN